MKLVFADIFEEFEFENNILNLVIENKLFYRKLRNLFILADSNEEVDFVISEGDKEINIHKNAVVINDIFSFEINSKKFIGPLIEELKDIYNNNFGEECVVNFKRNVIIMSELLKNSSEFDFEFESDIEDIDIIKVLNPKFNQTSNVLENMIDIIKISSRIKNIKLIIAFDLFKNFDENEIEQIYKEIRMSAISLLNVESSVSDNLKKCYIIDNDYCII